MYVFGSGWGDWIGFGLYQFRKNMRKVGYVCLLVAVVWVVLGESGWAAWVRVGGVMSVCVVSLDFMCLWQVQVYVYCARQIIAHLRCINPVAPYRYLLLNLYLSVADIANPYLFACSSRTWISLDIARFYEEHCQPSSGFAWPACPKDGNRAPIAGGGRDRHNLHRVCQPAVTALPRVVCVVWSQKTFFTKGFACL